MKTLEQMSEKGFDTLLNQIEADDFDNITPQAFGEALWAVQEQRAEKLIELTAEVVGDNLHFEANEALPVNGNELIFNDTRIRIKLKPANPSPI
jgi:hypothetical protein